MSVDIVSVAIRALSFVALFQAAGIALFMALLGQVLTASAGSIRRVARHSAWLAILLVIVHQLLAAARMLGEYSGVLDVPMQLLALQAHAGTANILRMAGLLFIACTVMRNRAAGRVASVVGATLVAMSFLVTGHTSSHPQRWVMAPLLLVHLWVAAFWFGSLWALYVCSASEARQVTAALVVRFSAIATWLVPGIAIAGALMAIMLLPGVNALMAPYGLLLLAKATGFALLMGLASLNKWRFGPALARGDVGAAGAFRRSVMIEYGLICLVLGVTAVMTGLFSPES